MPKDKLPFLDFEILHLYTSYDIACVEASSEFKTLVRTMGDHEPRINQFQFMLMLCIFRPQIYHIDAVYAWREKKT